MVRAWPVFEVRATGAGAAPVASRVGSKGAVQMLEGFWGVLALVAIACLVALGLLWWIFTLPFHFLGFLLTGLGVALVVTFLVVAGSWPRRAGPCRRLIQCR
jgi:hypothetical protein